jgi:hypothetical protein
MSGVGAFVYGGGIFMGQLLGVSDPLADGWYLQLWLVPVLMTFVAAERLLAAAARADGSSGPERVTRTLLVVTAGAFGLAGLHEWTVEEHRTLLWLGLAAASALAGLAFNDSRYRWTSLGILVVATAAVLQVNGLDQRNPSLYYRIGTGLATVVLLVLSWIRAFRQRRIAEHPPASE